jgi:hypothetical protein
VKTFNGIISAAICISLVLPAFSSASDDSGTFRGKWWNYYDRALEKNEKGDNDGAVGDLKSAISKREKDQRMARTYGMHFIDYFPHRELGIIYFLAGENEKALAELEESIRCEETAKAVYYLNKARKAQMEKTRGARSVKAPVISIASPVEGSITRELTLKVSGRASGEGLISRISVNKMFFRFEMAQESILFEKEVQLSEGMNRVAVRAEDLIGNVTDKELSVIVDIIGPTVNIFDVASVEQNGQKAVRITGEVSDETGLGRVVLDNRTVEVNNSRSYDFAVFVPYADNRVPSKCVIRAFDSLGNETRAELEPEKELSVFMPGKGWDQLAFNGSSIFSSDKEPPLIKLKEGADIPQVFADRYYIDGEVSDNKAVEKVVINNREVPVKKGRKIFFNKALNLGEGKNRIVIEAFDTAGNRSAAEINVKRTIPEVLRTNSRMSVSVLPFESKKDSPYSRLAYEHLIGSFVDQKRFNVIERTKLEQVLLEHKLTKQKLTDPQHSIRVGRLVSADSILATSIKEDAVSIEIISRVINTETSEVMEVKDVFTEDKSLSAVKELMDGLASKVAASFPLAEGMVINKSGSMEIYSDLGNTSRIKKNTGVIIYRKGKEIKHPVTGKSLGFDTVKLGEGRIEEIQKDFSKIKLSDKTEPKEINVKDLMITK